MHGVSLSSHIEQLLKDILDEEEKIRFLVDGLANFNLLSVRQAATIDWRVSICDHCLQSPYGIRHAIK